jgi:hypothetical protein
MTFETALATVMMAAILKEVPRLPQYPDKLASYQAEVAQMIEVDRKVAERGALVNPEIDRLLLGSVRFFESRFRVAPKDGDCREHRYANLPSGSWPVGFDVTKAPKWCPAKGPMQIDFGTRFVIPTWPEARELGIEKRRYTEDEWREPVFNVRLGYTILAHWKAESDRGVRRTTPPGVWFTAFGWGKVPPFNRRTVRYVDREGRRRCEFATSMMTELARLATQKDAGFSFALPSDWWCGHEAGPMPESSGGRLAAQPDR